MKGWHWAFNYVCVYENVYVELLISIVYGRELFKIIENRLISCRFTMIVDVIKLFLLCLFISLSHSLSLALSHALWLSISHYLKRGPVYIKKIHIGVILCKWFFPLFINNLIYEWCEKDVFFRQIRRDLCNF